MITQPPCVLHSRYPPLRIPLCFYSFKIQRTARSTLVGSCEGFCFVNKLRHLCVDHVPKVGVTLASHAKFKLALRQQIAKQRRRKAFELFDRVHPASEEVDREYARRAARLTELSGDNLVAELRRSGILPMTGNEKVNAAQLQRHFGDQCIVFVGTRVACMTGDSDRNLACTCVRFGMRGGSPQTECRKEVSPQIRRRCAHSIGNV